MVILVSYDLKKPNQNYEPLHEAIKKYGAWWHNLESTWIIETDADPKSILHNLAQYIDEDDKLLVIQVVQNWWGKGFTEKAFEWLKGRIFS